MRVRDFVTIQECFNPQYFVHIVVEGHVEARANTVPEVAGLLVALTSNRGAGLRNWCPSCESHTPEGVYLSARHKPMLSTRYDHIQGDRDRIRKVVDEQEVGHIEYRSRFQH